MWNERTELLIGKKKQEKLKTASVLVVGLGGVGGMACEMLCRAGVGHMTIIDRDTVSESNINRQLAALHSTVGHSKSEVLAHRLFDINPALDLCVITDWLDENNTVEILQTGNFDYVVDCIDTLSPKVFLLKYCVENGINVVSSMGAGAKIDPEQVKIADISQTNYCLLAKAVRKRLHRFGIHQGITVVYSTETVNKTSVVSIDEKYKKSTTGTIAYLPNLFGIMLASVAIRGIMGSENPHENNMNIKAK